MCCWYGDHPSNSWSTGGASWDGVSSHYERIRAMKPTIAGYAYNDARSGARMSDAPGQAAQGGYVTIQMGANDLCTSSTSTMTSAEAFRSQFRQTLATLNSGLAGARSSSPASRTSITCGSCTEATWWPGLFRAAAGICQSLLSLSNTDTQRQAVRDREVAFNAVLAQECGQYANCKFDGNAVFDYRFTKSQVSKLDYFHPSLSGQAALAGVTWRASWWGG